jgi:hypothetical protein
MAYRVQTGSFTVVAPSPQAALRIHEKFAEDDPNAFISDMNGSPLNVERLREIAQNAE